MNLGKQFKDGMLTQNPVLVQVLGMCSTMAITDPVQRHYLRYAEDHP